MSKKNKLLSVLSDAEQEALYGLPEFDDAQQLEYLAVTETELALANSRPSLHAKVYCLLQIGYFKAKHAFFSFDWDEVEDDCAFVLSRYFHGEVFEPKAITKHERYTQREQIAKLFGYWPWSAAFLPQLEQQAARTVRRDVTPGFVAAELIVWLNEHKIIRPGYTTLQELVSETLSAERRRLGNLLEQALDESAKAALSQLLVRDDTLSQLAALKQDAKNFGWRQMVREREKRATLEPLHAIAKTLLPKLDVSQQNLLYYASLANFYTVHDLRNLKADQTQLYLLCYAWVRYRQLSDNLVDAMAYHMKQLEDESSAGAKQSFADEQVRRQQETPRVGRLLSLYVDDSVADPTPFFGGAAARLQDHASRYAANHGAAYEREAGEQAGLAVAGGGRAGRPHAPPSSSTVRCARPLRLQSRQSMACRAGLGQRCFCQAAAAVATATRRVARGDTSETLAAVPADLRRRR
ncbi:hypothetical protein TUM12139_51630 (plasmid) [Klebsiella pneumoniae]|nr:hypothetical protein TUM12139_51630 [Klebsiella pneumoniae]